MLKKLVMIMCLLALVPAVLLVAGDVNAEDESENEGGARVVIRHCDS
jgi:hypothetical protein